MTIANVCTMLILALLSAIGSSGFTFVSPSLANLGTKTISHEARTCKAMTELALFGGKKSGSGDKKSGPGMMDQIAMLKKAQEVASKKMAMDKDLAKDDHVGSGADGKVKVTIKYVPPPPMQQPGYDTTAVYIDADYLESASAEELSAAFTDAIKGGYGQAVAAVTAKMAELTKELGSIMGSQMAPGA